MYIHNLALEIFCRYTAYGTQFYNILVIILFAIS